MSPFHQPTPRLQQTSLSLLATKVSLRLLLACAMVVSAMVLLLLKVHSLWLTWQWPEPTARMQHRIFEELPELNVPAGYWQLSARYSDVTSYGFRADSDPSGASKTIASLKRFREWNEIGRVRVGRDTFLEFERSSPISNRILISIDHQNEVPILVLLVGTKAQLDALISNGGSEQMKELVRRTRSGSIVSVTSLDSHDRATSDTELTWLAVAEIGVRFHRDSAGALKVDQVRQNPTQLQILGVNSVERRR